MPDHVKQVVSLLAFKDLRQFISFLEKKGELVRIKTPVSRDLEITEKDIPFVIRELRASGGHSGYRRVAQLCR